MDCPHCTDGDLELIPADEPYNEEHYLCSLCDSTYTLNAIEEMQND